MTSPNNAKYYLSNIGPYDVLCGRDKESYNNIGNRRFRIMININLPNYLICKTRTDRSKMILEVTHNLHPFRFFKRLNRGDAVDGMSPLVILDSKQSREKIAHALRDAASLHRIMKRKQNAQHEMPTQLTQFSDRIPETRGNRFFSELPPTTTLDSLDVTIDAEELSQTTEMHLSDMFDCDLSW